MIERRARWVARAILASRTVDTAYRTFDRARSRAVVRWASDRSLAEFNAIAYERDDVYHPAATRFRSRLFPWEVDAIRDHFDPPPGRILLGGAGGGREAFALVERGYEVVAFEPAPELAAAMATSAESVPGVRAYRGSYEQLPLLSPARSGDQGADARDIGPFCAAIMGWGSFSHLPSSAARVDALAAMKQATAGPILVSFLSFGEQAGARRPLRSGNGTATFSIFIGCYHTIGSRELEELARAAGLDVVALNTDETDSSWPHAILRRRE